MVSRNRDQHILIFDPYFVDRLLDLGPQRGFPCAHVKLPAVPRASDGRALDKPLGKWPPLMRANPIDRRDNPSYIIKRVDSSFELDFRGGSLRKLGQGRQLDESRHRLISDPLRPRAIPIK